MFIGRIILKIDVKFIIPYQNDALYGKISISKTIYYYC